MIESDGNGKVIVDKKLLLPLGFVIVLITAAVSLAAFAYGQSARIDVIENKCISMEQSIVPRNEIDTKFASLEKQLDEVKDDVKYIRDKIDSIK